MENLSYNGQREDYQDLIDNGYEFKLGDYISGGWNIATQNIGGFVGFSLIIPIILIGFYAIVSAIVVAIISVGGLSSPSVGAIMLISIVAIGAYITLFAGIYLLGYGYFCVADKIQRQEYYSFSDFFGAFAHWKQILYYQLMNMLIMLLCSAPAIVVMAIFVYIPMFKGEIRDPEDMVGMMSFLPFTYLFMIPAYYFIISYSFAPFLIMFGGLTYWDAMETSRKVITKKFFWFLLFYIVLVAIMYMGLFALLVGILFSIPVVACMMYAAYNSIMGTQTSSIDHKIDEIGANDETIRGNSW